MMRSYPQISRVNTRAASAVNLMQAPLHGIGNAKEKGILTFCIEWQFFK